MPLYKYVEGVLKHIRNVITKIISGACNDWRLSGRHCRELTELLESRNMRICELCKIKSPKFSAFRSMASALSFFS